MGTSTIYEINPEKCVRCGLCREECPTGAVKETGDVYSIDYVKCIECGHCGAVCPKGAVQCNGEDLETLGDHLFSGDQAFALIAGKRSVRQYKADSLSPEVLEKILETGALTGTATNSRDIRAKVFREEEVVRVRRALCSKLLGLVKLLNNPVGRLIARWTGAKKYANPKVLKAFAGHLKDGAEGEADPLFFHTPALAVLTYPRSNKRFGRTNAVLAGQSMMLFAHALGIESCIIGFAEVAAKGRKGKKILGIPQDREVGLIFTLGYGVPKYHRLPSRSALTEN